MLIINQNNYFCHLINLNLLFEFKLISKHTIIYLVTNCLKIPSTYWISFYLIPIIAVFTFHFLAVAFCVSPFYVIWKISIFYWYKVSFSLVIRCFDSWYFFHLEISIDSWSYRIRFKKRRITEPYRRRGFKVFFGLVE